MHSDDPSPLPPDDEVFEFGDQTILRMWQQPFAPDGNPVDPDRTMMIRPAKVIAVVPTRAGSGPQLLENTLPPEANTHPEEQASTAISPSEAETAGTESRDGDDFGTMVVRPHPLVHELLDDERISRLEAKVEALGQAVERVQKTLDQIREALR